MNQSEYVSIATKQKIPFCLLRLPGEDKIQLILPSESPELFYSPDEINGTDFFLFAPFNISKKSPGIRFNNPLYFYIDEIKREDLNLSSHNFSYLREFFPDQTSESSFEKYSSEFHHVQLLFESGLVEKLVLSRTKFIPRPESFSEEKFFGRLCEKYPRAFVYMMYLPGYASWIGASPELLLRQNNDLFESVSLAGTCTLDKEFTNKEKEEQEFVSRYQERLLSKLGTRWEKTEPVEISAGNIKHLQTTYRFQKDELSSASILKEMHPTPAVCGTPKEEAFKKILEIEQHAREFYTGFLGYTRQNTQSNYFVNLRCAKTDHNKITLFTGGGLTAQSKLEDEWEETEAKARTLLSVIEKI